MLTDLNINELEKLHQFIGYVYEGRIDNAGKILFPEHETNRSLMQNIRAYCSFMIIVLDSDFGPKERAEYQEQCALVLADLPEWAINKDYRKFLLDNVKRL